MLASKLMPRRQWPGPRQSLDTELMLPMTLRWNDPGISSILPFGFHLRRLRVPNSFQYPVERHRDVERRWKRWLEPTVQVKKPESRRETFSGRAAQKARGYVHCCTPTFNSPITRTKSCF